MTTPVLPADVPKVPIEELPECHTLGTHPEGYSAREESCPNCKDKFTCLPAAVVKGLAPSTEEDGEVHGVLMGFVRYQDMIDRMVRRHSLQLEKQEVPADLQPSSIRPPAPKRTKKEWKSQPREIPPEQMLHLISGNSLYKDRGVRIDQPFELEIGMQLVRKKFRDTVEVIVTLRPTGFEAGGHIYPTLSAAAIALEKRSVSGNDFFSLTHPSVEIRSAEGKVLARGNDPKRRQALVRLDC